MKPTLHLPQNAARFAAFWLLFSLLGLTYGGPAAPPVQAATFQPSAITLTVRAGFDGYYKETQWLPVHVTLANLGAEVQATLRIRAYNATGNGEIAYTQPVTLPTQSRRELHLYVSAPTQAKAVVVELVAGGGSVLAQNTAAVQLVNLTDMVYGVVAGTPSAFSVFNTLSPFNGFARVAQLTLSDLPPQAAAWQALNVLVFSDVDTGDLTPEQRAALTSWVAAGGKLLVAGGPGWQKTAAGLTDLLPLIPAGAQTYPTLTALASFTTLAPPVGDTVVATGTLITEAVVLVADKVPLVIMRPMGYGQIIYLAADPAFAPLNHWAGLESFYRQLLGGGPSRPIWWNGTRYWYSTRNAVTLALPPAWAILGFLGTYLLLILISYPLLRWRKRPQWAWFIIPAIVLSFSAFPFITGYGVRGIRPTLHQFGLVQVWPNTPYARVDQVVWVSSPRRADYDVAFPHGALAAPLLTDYWNNNNLAGNYTVQQGAQTVIKGVHLDINEAQPFVTQGFVPAPALDIALSLYANTNHPSLSGTITNRSALTFAEVVLLAPVATQRLGPLAPGQSLNVYVDFHGSQRLHVNNPTAPFMPYIPHLMLPYAPSWDANTLHDILGGGDYRNDPTRFQRFVTLSALINQYGSNQPPNTYVRGDGLYLMGWSEAAPLTPEVVGQNAITAGQTLYVFNIVPSLNQGLSVQEITPALMNWSVLQTNGDSGPKPYNAELTPETDYALRFEPVADVHLGTVQRLTLHLDNYDSVGPVSDLHLDIWNFATAAWESIPDLQWGDTDLPAPARFVSPAGAIQVQVRNSATHIVSFHTLNFTLELTPP